jgi:CubicO group peptidase (beta-lactamase class C family)
LAGKKNKLRNWLVMGAMGLGLIPLAVLSLFAYMTATKKPLYPNADDVPFATGTSPAATWTPAIDQARQAARSGIAEKNVPGLSVAVGVGGDIVWSEGFGFADLDDRSPVRTDTRFRIGTASVALTSAGAGLLIEQGKLKLDDEIQRVVPAYPRKEWPLTVRQVMAHTGGVPQDGGDEGDIFNAHCERAAEGLQFFDKRALRFEPDTHYNFTNFGWTLVSAAMEATAGEPFDTFMRQQVFEPLELRDTKVLVGTAPVAGLAKSYFPKFAGDPVYGNDEMRPINLSCYAGSSGFVSSASDLVRFAMAVNAGKLLKPETVRLMQTSQRLRSGEETGYGLGWDLETATIAGKPTAVIGHDGDIFGAPTASFMTLPEYGVTVALIANTSDFDAYSLALRIAEVFAARGKSAAGK